MNGLRRRASDLIGEINAVIFDAGDLDIVLGAPSVRRRYVDILISQIDRAYLRALQRYQRVVTQRNFLLKTVREGRAQASELDFWDDELIASGGYVALRRRDTVSDLSALAAPVHADLAGGETLDIAYDPSSGMAVEGAEADVRDALAALVAERRSRDIGQGVTSGGPHRDDLRLTLGRAGSWPLRIPRPVAHGRCGYEAGGGGIPAPRTRGGADTAARRRLLRARRAASAPGAGDGGRLRAGVHHHVGPGADRPRLPRPDDQACRRSRHGPAGRRIGIGGRGVLSSNGAAPRMGRPQAPPAADSRR